MGYLAEAAILVLEVLFGLASALFVLRVLLQLVRADFRNPISQVFYRASNPVLMPLRRVLPPMGRFDSAGSAIAYLLQVIKVVLISALVGAALSFSGALVLGLAELIALLLMLYFWLILIRAVLSFVDVDRRQPLLPLLAQLTEPVLRPLRRRLPILGGFDLSPLVALLLILLARLLVVRPLQDLSRWLSVG